MWKHLKSPVLLITLWVFSLAGCKSSPAPIPPPITPSPTASPSTTAIAGNRSSSSEVLAACPIGEQQMAMRNSQIPDWPALGIFACYQLSLTIDAGSTSYLGEEILTLANQTGVDLTEVVLRLFPNAQFIYGGKMTIISTRVDGQSAENEVFLSDHTAMRIKLPSTLPSGKTIQITTDYTISVPQDINSENAYGVFNYSTTGPQLTLANWFPMLAVWQNGDWQAPPVLLGGDAVTSQTALYKVNIQAPPGWKIAATGKQIQEIANDQSVAHQFVSGPVRDFMLAAGPTLQSTQIQVGDIALTQWGQADTRIGWPDALDDARTALDFYNREFGEYPFNELDIIASPLQYATGVEYPGLILIGDHVYRSSDNTGLLQVVIAHEIAHQWWYSVIGNNVLQDPWQDEALATYSSLAYLQSLSSPIYTGMLNQFQSRVNAFDQQHPDQSITQPVAAFQDRLSDYSLVVYQKGALFFEDLQTRLGKEKMFRSLNEYYQTNQYNLVAPAALLAAFDETCQCNLSTIERKYGVPTASP